MPPASEWLVPKLRGWANQMAMRFGDGTEVYLVGSALRKEHPLDVDVTISLPDAAFAARYGVPIAPEKQGGLRSTMAHFMSVQHTPLWSAAHRRWGREVQKVTMHLVSYGVRTPDLKVQPKSHSHVYAGKHRLRLDDLHQEAA